MQKAVRNGKTDLMKFIFSVAVVIFHFNVANYNYIFMKKGYIAVEFFFVTSGFLFAKSVSKISYQKESLIKDSLGFMKRKYFSLFPCHVFFFIACFIYTIFSEKWGYGDIFVHIFRSMPDFFMLQQTGLSDLTLLRYEWYLSAMIIVMFILTPLAIRYRDIFLNYICPIICGVVIGFLYHQKSDINFTWQWLGICQAGIFRAAAEISLGCICYSLCEKGILDRFPKVPLIIMEAGIYIIVLVYASNLALHSMGDYTILVLTAAASAVSFSERTSISFLNNRFVYFLGKLSFPMYLSQLFVMEFVRPFKQAISSPAIHTVIFVVSVMAAALICLAFTSDKALKTMKNIFGKIR